MSLIKSLVFFPTQQHTLEINFYLPLVLGLLIVVLLIIFVHPLSHFTSYHQINHISIKLPNGIKSLQIILEVFLSIKIMF